MKSSRPKGGVIRPRVMHNSINKPNHIGSYPRANATGINIGTQIMIMDICSIIVPSRINKKRMEAIINIGEKGKLVAISTIPLVIPVKAKSWLKATDPATIIKIIVEMDKHLLADVKMTFIESFPYTAAKIKLAREPRAEASVGVAIPENILPRTAITIEDNGRRYFRKSFKRFEEDFFLSGSPAGASEGLIMHEIIT